MAGAEAGSVKAVERLGEQVTPLFLIWALTTASGICRFSPLSGKDGIKACSKAGLAVTAERFSKRSKMPAEGILLIRRLTASDQVLVGLSESLCVSTLIAWLELAIRDLRSCSESIGKD